MILSHPKEIDTLDLAQAKGTLCEHNLHWVYFDTLLTQNMKNTSLYLQQKSINQSNITKNYRNVIKIYFK